MAIKLVSKLAYRSIRVKDVFASKTVHALHLRLAQHQQQVMIEGKREQGVLVGELPLLPVQRWFTSLSELLEPGVSAGCAGAGRRTPARSAAH